ncbi:MAG TPA: DMT family transporter [Alphaproteobacteria bacterium]|nr:DMT family transporter [Alphaproteobacteria bacterium]
MSVASPVPVASLPRAMVWMAGALVSFSAMALAGRELSSEISLFQVLFLRNVICLAVLGMLAGRLGWRQLATRNLRLHVLRNSVHYAASYCWFLGVVAIPLSEVFAIEFTAPIWTALLAALFLREPLTRQRVGAIALGFVGILVILRPGAAIVHPAAFAVLAAAVGYGSVYVVTKRLTGQDSPFVIVFYMNLVQLMIGVAPTLWHWVTPSAVLLPWVAVVGISGLTSHYCISRAMAHADATVVAPLDFLRLPLIAVVGWLLYAEPLNPFVALGAALVVAGNLVNLFGDRRARPATAPARPSKAGRRPWR